MTRRRGRHVSGERFQDGVGVEQHCRPEGVVLIVRVHAADHDGGARLLGLAREVAQPEQVRVADGLGGGLRRCIPQALSSNLSSCMRSRFGRHMARISQRCRAEN